MTNLTSLTDRQAARRGERDTESLVAAAAAGEQRAWSQLIDRYAVLIRSVCRAHRLCDADADDVAQLTWLRAVEHIGRLRDPDRFGAWVGTTARHECLAVLRGRKRVVPTADEMPQPLFAQHADPDEAELAAERRDAVRAALARAAAAPADAAAAAALRLRAELRGDRLGARHAGREHRPDPRPRARAPAQRTPARAPFGRIGLAAMSTDDPVDGVGLCLSGGGYRAMLFHVGVVWRLHDAGWLDRLDRVSSVSGGSITAGALALAWPRIAADGLEASFVAPVRALAGRTVDQSSVIMGALTSDTISERVSKAYREHLFGDATLQDLPDHPRFVINATSVQSGALFRFSKPYMADWRVGRVDRPRVALADAVAASSAFPPVLSPFELDLRGETWVDEDGNDLGDGEYRERAVLSDGGVYDNLGLETAWKACRTILVSDAGGLMKAEPDPDHDWGRHLFRVLGVIDNQVRALRKRETRRGVQVRRAGGRLLGHPQRHRGLRRSPTRCRPRTRRRSPSRRSRRGWRASTARSRSASSTGATPPVTRGCARTSTTRCPHRPASPIRPPGSGREARAQAAGAVGLRPGPAAPLHAGLAGDAGRLDGLRRRRSRRAPRPPARAASRGGRGRAGARAPAQSDHGRPAGHAARLQPVARRGRADLRGARAGRAADVELVAPVPVAARTPTTWTRC